MMGLNLLIKPIWILIENVIQDTIGHTTFGLYSALISLVLILSVFLNLGINHYVTNTLAKDKGKYEETVSTFFGFRLATLILFPLLCIAVGFLISYKGDELKSLFVIALSQAFLQFALLFRAKFQAFQNFVLDSVASIFDRLVLIGLIGFAFLFSQLSLEYFIYSRLIAFIITFLILLIVVIKKYGSFKLSFSIPKLRSVLVKTLPFTLMTLLYAFNERIDMIMIERLYSKNEAGLYAGAYRWYDALMMIVWLLSPMFFSKFSSNENEEHSGLLKNGKLLMAIPVILIGSLLLIRNEFIFFLFENSSIEEIQEMSIILSVLMGSYLLNGIFVLYGTYLNAAGFVTKVNWLVAVSVLTNIILNWFLIPQYGAIASAYATALSTFILSIGYYILIRHKLQVDGHILFKLIALAILLVGSAYLFNHYLTIHWILYLVLSSIAFVVLFFLLGLYKPFKSAIRAK